MVVREESETKYQIELGDSKETDEPEGHKCETDDAE